MTLEEVLVPGPAVGLAGLLSLDTSAIADGWAVPPLWHWVYLLERPAQDSMQPDGHSRTSLPTPPAEGLRRMVAGGRVTTLAPLRLGEVATSTTEVVRSRDVVGRSGPFCLTTVRRRVWQGARLCVDEEQDVAYLSRKATGSNPNSPTEPGVVRPTEIPDESRCVELDAVLLFRFSALTYNAHRIHYDSTYAMGTEGYRGLVVHGPLQALLMSELVRSKAGAATPHSFAYRLVAPLFLGDGLEVEYVRKEPESRATVRDRTGRITAVGTHSEGATSG
jgi:3-methylfumaryl-CoA hydratase